MRWLRPKTWWDAAIHVGFVALLSSALLESWPSGLAAFAVSIVTAIAAIIVVLELEPSAWERATGFMRNTGPIQDRKRLIIGVGVSLTGFALAGLSAGIPGIVAAIIVAIAVVLMIKHLRGLL